MKLLQSVLTVSDSLTEWWRGLTMRL